MNSFPGTLAIVQKNRLLLKPCVCVLQKQGYDRVLRGAATVS